MSEVSLKEFIEVQFKSLRNEMHQSHISLVEKMQSFEDQNAKRRHETLGIVTVMKAKQEEYEKEMSDKEDIQNRVNTKVYVWLSILSLLVVFSLIGLASEAGSLLGIIIGAF